MVLMAKASDATQMLLVVVDMTLERALKTPN